MLTFSLNTFSKNPADLVTAHSRTNRRANVVTAHGRLFLIILFFMLAKAYSKNIKSLKYRLFEVVKLLNKIFWKIILLKLK